MLRSLLFCVMTAGLGACATPKADEVPPSPVHDATTTLVGTESVTPEPEVAVRRVLAGGAPKGYSRMTVGGVAPAPGGNAVVLVDTPGDLAVAIFIGANEALSIQLRLEQRAFRRPLTHDLVDSLLTRLGGEIASVRVDRVEDEVYYGTIVILDGDRRVELDARPSDAIALAVGKDAPIYVSSQVIANSGMKLDALEAEDTPAAGDDADESAETISL